MRHMSAMIASVLVLPGCPFGPLDSYGTETVVTEESQNGTEPEDDRIEDKNPVCDPARTVVETFEGCEVELDKTCAVTKLDIAPLENQDRDLVDLVFPGRAGALAHVEERTDRGTSIIPSMEVVNGAMKPFNDGLYAAVEHGVEEGIEGIYPSKRAFLHDLLAALLALGEGASAAAAAHIDDAASDVAAALVLAGEEPSAPADVLAEADARVAAFEREGIFSRPIGFYTWDPVLGEVFAQDRYLQNYQVEGPPAEDPCSAGQIGKAAALALALDSDPGLMDRYEGYLALYAGLTNPYMNHPVTRLLPYMDGIATLDDPGSIREAFLADHPPPDLEPQCQPHFALFPSSESRETVYFESLTCAADSDPMGLDYMDALIRAIRDGLVDLTPDEDSGWYDYESHALETLLLPERGSESENLLLTAAYKEKLMDTFRSIITQNRETHVKQLEIGATKDGAIEEPVDIYPYFPVEPFPTFYLRSARAYRFLATYLEAVLGEGFLDATSRMTEDGTSVEIGLGEELAREARLLYGLHLVAADAVGIEPGLLDEELLEYPAADCREAARAWLEGWRLDMDVMRDPRVIVPVHRDREIGENVYWAVVGVKVVKARAEFVEGHEPVVIGPAGESHCSIGEIVPHEYYMLVEAFAEVRIRDDVPPPTRDEFRAICDAHDSVAGIVEALEAL